MHMVLFIIMSSMSLHLKKELFAQYIVLVLPLQKSKQPQPERSVSKDPNLIQHLSFNFNFDGTMGSPLVFTSKKRTSYTKRNPFSTTQYMHMHLHLVFFFVFLVKEDIKS